MDKTVEIFELDKIPDSALIKRLLIEIGKLKSENDELNYKLSGNFHKQSNNSVYITDMENQVNNLKKKITRLKSKSKSTKLQEEIDYLRSELRSKNKRIDILEKQLLKELA